MSKLSISNKILGGFGFILIMCICIVFLAKYNLDQLSRNIFFMQQAQFPILKKTHEMSGQFRLAAVYLQKMAQGDTRDETKQAYENARESCKSFFDPIFADLKRGLGKGADKSKRPIENVQDTVTTLFDAGDTFLTTFPSGSPASVAELIGLINEKVIEVQGQSEGIFSFFETSEGKRIQRELDRMIKTLDILMKILPVVIILFGVGFTYFISTGIAGPLQKIIFSMGQAERGILETRIEVSSQDEFQRVADSFNNMIEGIRQIIVKVIETSQDLATSSQELSSASVESAATLVDISKNVNEINTSAVEVSTNLEKTSVSIENVANSAGKVASLAETAVEAAAVTTQAANSGGQTVKKSVEMIGKIKESVDIATQVILDLNAASMQIGEIVNTITTIASQTNLLALNAAIEAARAGEQGKGFTVVADEVRKLAEESAEAAEAIGTRIENILTKTQNAVDSMQLGRGRVDEGIRVIRDVSISLDNITKNIDGVNTKIKEISRISSEQSSNSHIMARTVEDITKLTKSTSERMNILALSVEQQTATVSEISGSTEDLARLADELQLLVSRFTVQGQNPSSGEQQNG
jgi:methyl-accepting chemotaxis protein